jgi:predicted ATPase
VGYSRWVLADLQVHTPADFHHKYGNVGGPAPDAAFAETLIKAHADAGVTVVAVTDRNTLDWYPVLAAAGREYGVTVFPGIEFNVNKCHLMAIWDCTDDGYRRGEHFLAHLFPPSGQAPLTAQRQPNPTTAGSPLDLVKAAAETYGALVLAPHSTAKGIGLFASNVCNISDQVAQSGHVLGFDVWNNEGADVLRNPRAEFGNHTPAWFVSGDVRDLDTVGKRAAYLKLGTPIRLESLRQAFLMPHQRIRFPEHLRAKFGLVRGLQFLDGPEPAWPRLTSITVAGGFHDGLIVEFGPGLNAIIGGKGTGKSTAIEIVRHTCGAADPKSEDNKSNRKTNFSANATANVGIVAGDKQRYEIVRSGDDAPPQLRRGGLETGLDVARRFGLSVFGQRELAMLADNQAALRDFLAINADPRLRAAHAEEKQLTETLVATGEALGKTEKALAELVDSEEKLKDVRDQLAVAGQHGAEQQFEASHELTAAQEEVADVKAWVAGLASLADQLRTAADRPSVREHDCVPEAFAAAGAEAESAIRAAADTIAGAVRRARTAIDATAAQHDKLAQARRHEINVALANTGLKDPDELARLQRAEADLGRTVANAPAQRQRQEDLRAEHHALIEELRGVRQSISHLLQAAAADLTATVGGHVRVVVEPQADRSQLKDLLVALVAGQNVNRDQLAKLAEADPAVLVAAIEDDEQLIKLGASEATARKLQALTPSNVRAIEQCVTPDLIIIQINLSDHEQARWTDVRKVSPGQKATAMLSLALVTGADPLIIDQPEDDIDNRYIYNQVVRQIAEVAARRQIIVATHNPNIPILGDAELILALDATIDRSRVVACGAIDEPAVADAARQILEGGDKAFQDRARRYRAAR